ncbi:DNA-directed RNA polymerase subunit alpha [Candidatus Collierbacteria bacterium]|nr:DNA-directed RNA polymerase subunit alpha [Candidatus Collierbacteria bacterium]
MLDQPFHITTKDGQEANEGIIVFEPLRQGFGHTLGVSLRRVMLSGLNGAAVTKIKIKGATHQFTTLKGMNEDVVELILNIKQLKLAYTGDKPETLSLQITGEKEVTAADLECPATVKIANPDLVLANLSDKKSKLSAELTVEMGTGYLSAEEQGKQRLGIIPVDASFSPVSSVFYKIESTRVGRRTDYDKLIMTVKTDGTISPKDAVIEAAKILVENFQQVVTPSVDDGESSSGNSVGQSTILKLTVEELGLPTRIANALLKAGYKTIGDIVAADKEVIAKVKNIGSKSVSNIYVKIREKGVQV